MPNTITQITPAICKDMREQLNAALALVAKDFNVSFDIGKMTYSSDSVTMKVEALLNNADGTTTTPEAKAYLEMANRPYTEAEPEWLGKEVTTVSGEKLTLVGYRPRARKQPYIVTKGNGKQYIMTEVALFRAYGFESKASHNQM